MDDGSNNSLAAGLESAKRRCAALQDRVNNLPSSKISESCRRTLIRLLDAELRFLCRPSTSIAALPFSLNVGYLEAVVHIVEQPSVTRVSRICKSVAPPPARASASQRSSKPVHVDIVCTVRQRPVWFLVSDRNPGYVSWAGSRRGDCGVRARLERVISAARSAVSMRPESIVLFFAKGVDGTISEKLADEYSASDDASGSSFLNFFKIEELEDGWVNVIGPASRAFEIEIGSPGCTGRHLCGVARGGSVVYEENLSFGKEFALLVSRLEQLSREMPCEESINFDTTALIALVSGISNGGTDRMLRADKAEMGKRFKGNYEFVMEQVMSELQNPILPELSNAIGGKKGIVCESALSEFKDIVKMCGGMGEKARAERLLHSLVVVSDSPSARIIGLPTTRKIAMKNKIIFGTGDYWHAPTLTANIGFVRAILQTGMPLLTLEHRPRALIGD